MKFEELEDGVEVSFNVEDGEKGLQATTVNPIPAGPGSVEKAIFA
jgi:cold shock CspA family protein